MLEKSQSKKAPYLQLRVEGLVEAYASKLGRTVIGAAVRTEQSSNRADRNDVATVAVHHFRQEGTCGLERKEAVCSMQ